MTSTLRGLMTRLDLIRQQADREADSDGYSGEEATRFKIVAVGLAEIVEAVKASEEAKEVAPY